MRKLVSVQYLRAIAAIGVLVFHAGERFGYRFEAGAFGVDLFFVISGFLMVAITDEKTAPNSFVRDRLERIVPIYWLATSVMVIGALVGLFPNLKLEWWHSIASYFFIPAPSPVSELNWPILVPGWTINYEIFFYAIFSILLFAKNQFIRVFLLTVALFSLVIFGGSYSGNLPAVKFYTDPIILEFAFGAWIGIAWKVGGFWQKLPVKTFLLSGAALFMYSASTSPNLPRSLMYGIPSALMLVGVLARERRGTPPRSDLLELLGDASYSIYLWHGLAVSTMALAVVFLRLPPLFGFVAAILAGLIGGVISFWLIERPVTRLLKRRQAWELDSMQKRSIA